MRKKKRLLIGPKTAFAILAVHLLVTSTHAAAQQETVLHSFDANGNGDGYNPYAGLIFDGSGNLYGTTRYGGADGYGTVFELTPTQRGGSWTETVLHNFTLNGKDGVRPYADLVFDASGNLYGTTVEGGTHGNYGTVFELTPTAGGGWTEKILHAFNDNSKDGYNPYAGLVFDASGNLYGTTRYGGAHHGGTVFKLTPKAGGDWTEAVLHNFNLNGKDGVRPFAALAFDASSGNLYGTTYEGGAHSGGTVFALMPQAGGSWTEKVLHSFNNNGEDGLSPYAGLILDASGNLYGTTVGGGVGGQGTAFELKPKAGGRWTETVLYKFNKLGNGDGMEPYAGLVFDGSGNLYGTTETGGAYDSYGTVFELTPTTGGIWTEKILHSFDDNRTDGLYPYAGLIFDTSGNLYGTTVEGGAYGLGTVFEITP
jgi:uncharacterized repeat protein (TIGR03803 family)